MEPEKHNFFFKVTQEARPAVWVLKILIMTSLIDHQKVGFGVMKSSRLESQQVSLETWMASGHARGLCIAAGNSFLPLIKTIIYLVLSSEACFQTCYILKEPHIFQGNKDLVLCNETLLWRREDKKLRTVTCAPTLPFNAKSFLGLGMGLP